MSPDQKRRYIVYQYILDFWREHKKSPSLRDIADEFRTSTSVISYYLDALVEDGYIMPRTEGEARTIIPVVIADAIDEFFSGA